jgi:hypothetical protein
MPLISVITAAYAPSADYLAETAAAIAAPRSPARWELEWVVQEDGERPQLAGFFADVDHARYGSDRPAVRDRATHGISRSPGHPACLCRR